MVSPLVGVSVWALMFAVTVAGKKSLGQVIPHRNLCLEEPLEKATESADIILSGKLLSQLRKTTDDSAADVRVIHVYRGLLGTRSHVLKVKTPDHLLSCVGWAPRGAVRVLLLRKTTRQDTFQLSGGPLRLSERRLSQLHASLKGESPLQTSREAAPASSKQTPTPRREDSAPGATRPAQRAEQRRPPKTTRPR